MNTPNESVEKALETLISHVYGNSTDACTSAHYKASRDRLHGKLTEAMKILAEIASSESKSEMYSDFIKFRCKELLDWWNPPTDH
jgi:hypothetical protein